MERIVGNAFVGLEHIWNKLFNEAQQGFIFGESCFTQRLESSEDVTEALDNGFGLVIISLDSAKAFDGVPH